MSTPTTEYRFLNSLLTRPPQDERVRVQLRLFGDLDHRDYAQREADQEAEERAAKPWLFKATPTLGRLERSRY